MFHASVIPDPIEGETPFSRLSPAARTAWAKHDRKTEGWLPLWRHMADSGAVAGKLWEHWVPRSVRELVAETLPAGESDARKLMRFLASVHDAGKSTPAFSCQVETLATRMRDAGLDMPTAKVYGLDRRLAPHGLAGQLLLQEWMAERFGLGGRASGQFAVVAGGHHGTPPDHQQIHDLQLRPHLLRHPGPSEEVWRRVQYELMDGCADLAEVTERLPEWGAVRLPQPVQVILTALVIMSDWIASAPELFPYDPETWQPVGPVGERRRLRAAWDGLDLPKPWAPQIPQGSAQELFAERFPKLGSAAVRPVQSEAVRMARAMSTAGLLMIEAPMGEGKTEAALAAAEVLAARTGAGGVLVALPTRATGDAMFSRLLAWLDRLPQGDGGSRSVVLAHAKAALNDLWAGLLRQGHRSIAAVDPYGGEQVGEVRAVRAQPAGLHAHQWLRGRKKQLLASFAVGTIDQVLFAGLKSRHLALRHLAVAGKVVVIDEVHAYDAYMGRYLDRVLEWLAAYRVPVVLLSATLPAERRRSLAAAYAGPTGADVETAADAYPLITAVAPGRPALTARSAPASGRRTNVLLERLDDDVTVLADRLAEELADGGCALVVHNTVGRVLEAAEILRDRFGDEAVTVAHSRFLAADRAAKDTDLLRRFGPEGDRRPDRHVVVASQVVEQSLDIDFDLLVTDLAPVDLVLQRMGRLHRHPRRRPPRLARARCLITGVDWQTTPPWPVIGSRAVYSGEYTLLRSLAVLDPYLNGKPLQLPDDISPLVQSAYGEDQVGPDTWAQKLGEAQTNHLALLAEKREKAEGFLLGPVRRPGRPVYGWLEAHAGDADDSRAGRAQVRDSGETLEVLVVQRQADGRLTTVPWLDGDRKGGRGGLALPTDFPPSRRAAEAVAASALTLPGRFSKPWLIDRTIDELERFLVPAWQVKECPWLAGELLLVLDARCQTRLSGFDLTYSPADGLRVTSPDVPANSPGASKDGTSTSEGRSVREEGGQSEQNTCDQGSPATASVDRVPASEEQAKGNPVSTESPTTPGPPSFDLVSAPWLPVQHLDGTVEEVSLLDLFTQASGLRRLVGDLPTQEMALLRLLLAILYDALNGPAEIEDWEDLWLSADPFSAVPAYLDRHRDRFDLFHAEQPFYQVAGLRTAKGELAPLSRIVADVPVGSTFFSMRRPGVDRLSYAEAARWLVHTHAYDTSGIKSAMVGDEARAKSGKVYPLGVGSLGNLGGVFAEGTTLRETLLLNLIAFEEAYAEPENGSGTEDWPVWRRPPLGSGPREDGSGVRRPSGLRDLYTWQSRRVRLHPENGAVTGVVLGYGDPLALSAPWKLEPMSGWRRSPAQEKKQGRAPVYTSRRHDPSQAAWRGLGALLPARQQATDTGRRGEAATTLRPGVARWFTQVIISSEINPGTLVRLRLIGAVYGTQQSVVDEIVDDSVVLPVITLHEGNPVYGAAAVDAVNEAELAVAALGQLAGNLARAAGTDPGSSVAAARDLGFGTLDGPYRAWLKDLLSYPDPATARQEWRSTVRRHVLRLGRQLLASAGPAADEGRLTDIPGLGVRLMDAGRASDWFIKRLGKVLGPAAGPPGAGAPIPRQTGPGAVRDNRTESAS
ncbi:type I-E CRISPR-associated protein Cse1/CasA [Streptomyces sp. CNQ085]|uniref:type I-E CRISPR-associated protein Cse1/CasA n=1 Tax=Streptomyces sp. CNQ085 TaxID=2886944 RepID=UPI001F507144|nr:type I-E CRISPR-associated protein Cse1/CasA [Streptomyces sp. CNQ085]MCI0385089.1 type I-E CRISPR-associated protein Cse1/CasA [Streptomyces sp. CNQ085]